MVKTCTRYTIFNTFILIIYVNCKKITPDANGYGKLTYEKLKDTTTLKPVEDFARSDLVSDFFDHVKELFDADGANSTYKVNLNDKKINDNDIDFNLTNIPNEILLRGTSTKKNKILAMFENITLSATNYYPFHLNDPDITTNYKLSQLSHSTRSVPTIKTSSQKPVTIEAKIKGEVLDSKTSLEPNAIVTDQDMDLMEQRTKKLACIFCDNVNNQDCNNPENKLLPLTRCEQQNDKCYFMQTPFGIVDRGCYNSHMNHTTYVCSCNLCNSIPIHDLPFAFTNKSEWLTNIQELNNGRRLRKSVFSQMSCVQCEVNQTVDEVPDTNCLEGKYRVLPSQYCSADEICGIRSIRNEGYIWRGCVKFPRYNYLWRFCDNDLCNFDAPTSLFDIK